MAFTASAVATAGSLVAGGVIGVFTVLGVIGSQTSDPAKSPVDITDVSVPYGQVSTSGTTSN